MVLLRQWRAVLTSACVCCHRRLPQLCSSPPRRPGRLGGRSFFVAAGKDKSGGKGKHQSKGGKGAPAALAPGLIEEFLPGKNLLQNEDPEEEPQAARFMDAVVKVYCVHSTPNFSLPWQRSRQYTSTSTGFMVEGGGSQKWLLTNAHSVEYHSQVQVKRRGDDQKFIAEVLAIGSECDVALLTVSDEAFWEGATPLELGSLPRLQDPVAVVGYPIGGDTISVTSGVVSRIEVTSYVHGATELLGVQIDAAINSGNSGGPAFNVAGQVVGIAFQSMAGSGDGENIGYLIPTNVIQHFLKDFRLHRTFTGFPVLGVQWQKMESKVLRDAYKLSKTRKGVLIRKLEPIMDSAKKLKPYDIIMKFDGIQIASDGTVPFRQGERITFSYLVSQKYAGEQASLVVWRNGEELQMDVELCRPRPLVPLHLDGGDPPYLIVAGVVFTTCNELYLESEYGSDYMRDAPVSLLHNLVYGSRKSPDNEVVILSQVLACKATLGYEDHYNSQLKKVNGEEVNNLRHLTEMVVANKESYLTFDLANGETIVLDAKTVAEDTREILETHSIPSQVSKGLADLLPGAQAASQNGTTNPES